jgi:hypothetical protein
LQSLSLAGSLRALLLRQRCASSANINHMLFCFSELYHIGIKNATIFLISFLRRDSLLQKLSNQSKKSMTVLFVAVIVFGVYSL